MILSTRRVVASVFSKVCRHTMLSRAVSAFAHYWPLQTVQHPQQRPVSDSLPCASKLFFGAPELKRKGPKQGVSRGNASVRLKKKSLATGDPRVARNFIWTQCFVEYYGKNVKAIVMEAAQPTGTLN